MNSTSARRLLTPSKNINHGMPNLDEQEQQIDKNKPAVRLNLFPLTSVGLESGISCKRYTLLERQAVKNHSLKSNLYIGMFVVATGCVVEMHPADSSPAPSAMQTSAGGAPARAPAVPQPVQVVSGPSGINPPVRSAQPSGTTETSNATTSTNGAATTSTTAGGTSAALR